MFNPIEHFTEQLSRGFFYTKKQYKKALKAYKKELFNLNISHDDYMPLDYI